MSHNGVRAGSSSGAMQLKTFPSDDLSESERVLRVLAVPRRRPAPRADPVCSTGGGVPSPETGPRDATTTAEHLRRQVVY